MNASEATFKPTCFMITRARALATAAAPATSIATFSLVQYSKKYFPCLTARNKLSPISEEGVPGYVEASSNPASIAPRAIASFPRSR